MSWFADGITIDNLAYIAQSSEAVAKLTVGMSWFADGITETELEGTRNLGDIAHFSESTARELGSTAWFMDGITESEGHRQPCVHRSEQ